MHMLMGSCTYIRAPSLALQDVRAYLVPSERYWMGFQTGFTNKFGANNDVSMFEMYE